MPQFKYSSIKFAKKKGYLDFDREKCIQFLTTLEMQRRSGRVFSWFTSCNSKGDYVKAFE